MMDAIIFDIDGTLANLEHRLHHIKGKKKDYDAFFDAMDQDSAIEDVVRIARILESHPYYSDLPDAEYTVIYASGRPDSHRDQTDLWLSEQGLGGGSPLYMRKAGDHRPDDVVKREILQRVKADGYNVRMVFDDRQRVVDMWRDEGITCAQVAQWDENESKRGFADGATSITAMVGPSGAGKSTWLEGTHDAYEGHVLSSDFVRHQMTGDWQSQDVNNAVFSYMRSAAEARLKHGLPVVIDATNIRRKDRIVWPQMAAKLAPNTKVKYVVVNRPMAQKYEDAGWRKELPFDLIAKHEKTFQSQLKDILAGDYFENTEVVDVRRGQNIEV